MPFDGYDFLLVVHFFQTIPILRTNFKRIFLNWPLTFSRFVSYFIIMFQRSQSYIYPRLIVMYLCSYNLFVIGALYMFDDNDDDDDDEDECNYVSIVYRF